ncbi:hypothetical protein D3C77_620660 [compost metagenome]
MAAAADSPVSCSSRGRCAAIAVLTNQVAAKTNASSPMVRPAPAGSCTGLSVGGDAGWMPSGIIRRFSGRPRTICAAAQTRQVPRQPSAASSQPLIGQHTVLANPASKVIPVIAPRASRP